MGKEKHLRKIEALFEKSPVVDFSSISRIIKNKEYAKQLIRNLILKGKAHRITKGYYSCFNDPSLAVFCFAPSYLGLQDALSSHNLWEQETIPIVITARKVRQGIRKIFNANVLIRRIDKKYMFGYDYFPQGNLHFPYSDIEKTFIDMIYFNERLTEETLKEFKKRINKKKLNSYLKIYPKRIKKILEKI